MPTNIVLNSSSALQNISLITGVATNLIASTSLPSASDTLLTGYMSNLVNSSGVTNASSAVLYQSAASSVVGFTGQTSSSSLLKANQLLSASTAMAVLLLQNQQGIKIG